MKRLNEIARLFSSFLPLSKLFFPFYSLTFSKPVKFFNALSKLPSIEPRFGKQRLRGEELT